MSCHTTDAAPHFQTLFIEFSFGVTRFFIHLSSPKHNFPTSSPVHWMWGDDGTLITFWKEILVMGWAKYMPIVMATRHTTQLPPLT